MSNKVIINLATGLEDPERVTVAFLVGVSAAEHGQPVRMFLTKEAVRVALEDGAVGVACDGSPPLPDLAERYAEAGGLLKVCPVCINARKLIRLTCSRTPRSAVRYPCSSGSTAKPAPSSATEPTTRQAPDPRTS